ncbi:sensor histidine kinase, partial [Teichococcus aestuarii]|uniref:sensor histidine kinase n=1 Tax=Teichococcus aestuarii TaxID=568898 RepID=UPI003607673F
TSAPPRFQWLIAAASDHAPLKSCPEQLMGAGHQQALDLARGLALSVEGEIRARIAVLQVLALSRSLVDGDLTTFRAQAEAVVAQQAPGSNILLLRENGQQVLNTALAPGAPLPVRQYLENQRQVFATGRPSVSDIYFGIVLRRPLVAVEVPVRDADGRVVLVLALNPTLDAFEPLVRRQLPDPGWTIAIFDRAGVVVASVPSSERYIGSPVAPDMRKAWLSGNTEVIAESSSPEGARTLTSFSRVPELGWGVAVAVPVADLARPARRAAVTSLFVGLALLTLGLAYTHWIARGVLQPIRDLLRRTAAPDDNDPGPAPAGLGLPEADALALAHLDEARRRRAATAALVDSERRLRLVVAELDHRAKNALATVQSLAFQTARSDAGADPARFTEAFTSRLQALARAHDLLTAFSWEGAALGAVVTAGLAPWLAADEQAAEPRLVVSCPCDLPIPRTAPGQAQALAMALHELAVNAVKHGALSVPGGRVEVRCCAAPAGLSGEIEWTETGGPLVCGPPTRRGFGTRLLERALLHDLGPGARVTLDFAASGLRAVIRFSPQETKHEL